MRGTCGDRDVEFKEGNSFESDLEANENQKYCSIEQVMPHLLIRSVQNSLKQGMG